ncbi:MAG TPA: sugar phosphate isomerase/epimerase family protein [Solirubrobacteraceae bacterium]|jgi:sugar phosphate isomerase/epimerase|nr:sugar phosphate isomerase/epimerase family protein [Solirubrobacteraceae bacterium]
MRAATSMVDRAIGYVAADMGGRAASEIVALLAGAGYGAVDWTMEQFDPLRDPPERLRELVSEAAAAGLVVPQLMVHQDHVTLDAELWEERVRRAERAVLACAHAEIDSIGVLSGPSPWQAGAARVGVDLSEAHAWELALRALERVLDRAEEEHVRVALEPCWGTLAHGRYRAEHLLAALDCAALAVNFDPSHHVLCGDDIPGAVRAWGGRIAHVHLKDAFGVSGPGAALAGATHLGAARSGAAHQATRASGVEGADFTFLLPGAGAVPWRELFDALDAIGYTGAMSVENECHGLLAGALRGDLARAAALARELVAGLLDGPAPMPVAAG